MTTLADPRWPPLAAWDSLHARDYLANMRHRFEEGEQLANEQLALAQTWKDTPKELFGMLAQQQCAVSLGRLDDAVRLGRELVTRAEGEQFVDRMHAYVCNLATALLLNGEIEKALVRSRDAVLQCNRVDALWLQLDSLALLALRRDKPETAARLMGRADAVNDYRDAFREPVEMDIRKVLGEELKYLLPSARLAQLMKEGVAMSNEDAAQAAIDD